MATASVSEIREALTKDYDFRFNDVFKVVEYRSLTSKGEQFHRLVDYKINSIWMDLEDNGIMTSISKIRNVLMSEFSELADPIKDYFDSLPQWYEKSHPKHTPTDYPSHIAQLAATVRVAGASEEAQNIAQARFEDYLRRWLVASVANIYNPDRNTNHTMLVFKGAQGAFKTTWLQYLCPKPLRDEYLYTGVLDPGSKDSEILLAQTFIYNIDDQLANITKKDYNSIKQTITKDFIKMRLPYGHVVEHMPRRCNFVASVNDAHFLNDPSGSRRFLTFEVTDIDIDATREINLDMVYAEAKRLFELSKTDKYIYYFNRDEIAQLDKINNDFRSISPEEQLLNEMFTTPKVWAKLQAAEKLKYNRRFLKTTDILKLITDQTNNKMPSMRKLNEALSAHGYREFRVQKRLLAGSSPQWYYDICVANIDEVVSAQNQTSQTIETEKIPF